MALTLSPGDRSWKKAVAEWPRILEESTGDPIGIQFHLIGSPVDQVNLNDQEANRRLAHVIFAVLQLIGCAFMIDSTFGDLQIQLRAEWGTDGID
ncbi:MAG: hypothetical protein WAW16_07280 [Candidatus Cryosericum sp.]